MAISKKFLVSSGLDVVGDSTVSGNIVANGSVNPGNLTNFNLVNTGGNPVINVDNTDSLSYNRTSNKFNFTIGNANIFSVTSNAIAVTDSVVVKGGSTEGGQVTLNYFGNSSEVVGNSQWSMDVLSDNSYRIFNVNSSGIASVAMRINENSQIVAFPTATSFTVGGSEVWRTTNFNPSNYATLSGATFTGTVTSTAFYTDANSYSTISSGNYVQAYDPNDYYAYIRSADTHRWHVAGAAVFDMTNSYVVTYRNFSVNSSSASVTLNPSAGTDGTFVINAQAGKLGYNRYTKSGNARWDIGINSTAETGSNVGTDFFINRFADNGTYLNTPFLISRSNGNLSYTGAITASQNIVSTNGTGIVTLANNGDITANRGNGTGLIFLSGLGTRYVYYNGTNYEMPGADLYVNGGKVMHTSNDGSGSTFDADLLDGFHATSFYRYNASTVGTNMSRGLTIAGSSPTNDVWSAPIEIREVNQVGNTQTSPDYAPGILFHWSNIVATGIKMYSDGSLRVKSQDTNSNSYRPLYAHSFFATNNVTVNGLDVWHANNARGLSNGGIADPGDVKFVAFSTAPTGWLKANGAAISRSTYANLFAAIGTTFGAGDGSTTFNLPDLRGEFIRGWDDARGVDSGRGFGTWQDSQSNSLHEAWTVQDVPVGGVVGIPNDGNWSASVLSGDEGGNPNWAIRFRLNGNETRTRNVALLAIIKY